VVGVLLDRVIPRHSASFRVIAHVGAAERTLLADWPIAASSDIR
jgi:hypothetical protein